jgi:spore coat polysaccharide biosynthesis predicted glycosyltransferase SpsG/RimJ/RimL family protein N-acetyltransferase
VKSQRIIFRADGDKLIGLGHLYRCAAFSEALQKFDSRVLITTITSGFSLDFLKSSFDEIREIGKETDFIDFIAQNDIIVLDGYHFHTGIQILVKRIGAQLILIDDLQNSEIYADVVINPAPVIHSLYKGNPQLLIYSGPKYSMLRQPFKYAAINKPKKITNKNLFICLGGSDSKNETLNVLMQVSKYNYFEKIIIVVGVAYQYLNQLNEYIKENAINAHLFQGLDSKQIISQMQKADFAVVSPSTISYEYLTVGGIAYLYKTADNQENINSYLLANKLAFSFSLIGQETEYDRQSALEVGKKVFDGNFSDRLHDVVTTLKKIKEVGIRIANISDLMMSFNWANDDEVRLQSFNSSLILFSDHENWFTKQLNDVSCKFFILHLNNVPFAQIRFKISNGEATLSYLVEKSMRGKGYGAVVLVKGINELLKEEYNLHSISGFVKASNIGSQRVFERMRFKRTVALEFEDSYKYTLTI